MTRHGFGYSIFEHSEGGIATELCTYVALDAAVKYSVIKVRNDSGVARRLSVTGYVEWVMADLRAKSGMHVATEVDTISGHVHAGLTQVDITHSAWLVTGRRRARTLVTW